MSTSGAATTSKSADDEIKPQSTVTPNPLGNLMVKTDRLPVLKGQSNYQTWAGAWKITFDSVDWWENVSGEDEEPSDKTSQEHKTWKSISKRALALLLNGVSEELQTTITAAGSAHGAWKALKDLYDRETPATTINIITTLLNLRYQDGTSLQDHLTTFQSQWNRFKERCQDTTKESLSKDFHSVANSNRAKAALLLVSLNTASSMTNVIDNLQTKENLAYEDVYNRLTDLSANKSGSTEDTVFNTSHKEPCSYCLSKTGKKITNHLAKECRRLKKDREWKKNKGGKGKGKEDNASTITHNSATVLMVRQDTSPSSSWIFDSGATAHISPYKELFTTIQPYDGIVRTADGTAHRAPGIGDILIECWLPDGGRSSVVLTDVLLVPTFGPVGLISETVLDKKGCRVDAGGGSKIVKKGEKELLWGKLVNGHWNVQIVENVARLSSYSEWHEALGHPSSLHSLYADRSNIPKKPSNFHCEPCALSKSTHTVPKAISTRATKAFELVHSDLSGKQRIMSQDKCQYYMSFIDDYTRYSWIYFLKNKDDAHKAIEHFTNKIKNQHNTTIKRFRADGGGEYVNKTTKTFFGKEGITQETTPPYSHESNGVAERFNRTVTTMVRCMIMDHPRILWQEAYSTAVYLKNRLLHSALRDKTPYEALHKKKPTIKHAHPFGQKCYIHIHKEIRQAGSKLEPRAVEGNFVGYTDSDTQFRVWIPSQHKVVVTRDLTFPPPASGEVSIDVSYPPIVTPNLEAKVPESSPKGKEAIPLEEEGEEKEYILPLPDSDEESEPETHTPGDFPISPQKKEPILPPHQTPRRSTREKKAVENTTQIEQERRKDEIRTIQNKIDKLNTDMKDDLEVINQTEDPKDHERLKEETLKEHRVQLNDLRQQLRKAKANTVTSVPVHYAYVSTDPVTYRQAISEEDAELWKKAMKEEYDALIKNSTWELVERPTGREVVKGKWVYKVKHNREGTIERYKARYVAKGYSQIPGLDFDETFSPVARYDSLRLLLALAAHNGWVPIQLDVKTAFLHGVLKEEIYLELPEGYKQNNKVCKLRKCIYGLKQSPREWYACLADSLELKGFKASYFDPCVFIHPTEHIYLVVYVDDIEIIGPHNKYRQNIKTSLMLDFECTDLGESKYLLGLEIDCTPNGIHLSQKGYIQKMLEKFQMHESRPVGTPLEPNILLTTGTPENMIDNQKFYQSIIGSLMYASIGTRPDISHAVTFLSQFSSCPTAEHLIAAKRVLRYLKGTINWTLFYSKHSDNTLHGYSDSSFGSNLFDRKSFSGYVFQLGTSTISWRSRKQRSVATSTTEAEYMALNLTAKQLVWLKSGLTELGQKYNYTIHADNTGSIELVRNPRIHDRSKHIDIQYHSTREWYESGTFTLEYVPTNDNIADILTKGLPKPTHSQHAISLRGNK